ALAPYAFIRQMAKFSAAAKLTHARYGSSSAPAAGEWRQNARTVAAMASHNRTTSASAAPGRCSPKKRNDHARFSPSCNANRLSAVRAFSHPARRQTSHAATAMHANSTVHTGPNTQPGGVHEGFA